MVDEIPGTVYSGEETPEAPMFIVQAAEKAGKSCMATTLFDWPAPGSRPYVLAVDETGPDSCSRIGYQVACMKVGQQPQTPLGDINGQNEGKFPFFERMNTALNQLEHYFKSKPKNIEDLSKRKYTSVVVDCASTMTEAFLEDAKRQYKHGKKIYGEVLEQSRSVMWRLKRLGVPVFWLCWLQEPYEEKDEKGRTTGIKIGGPKLAGSFKGVLAGTVRHMLTLEKKYVSAKDPNADPEGFIRQLHTKTWNRIESTGRFPLPEPMPANLGLVLAYYYNMVENPANPVGELIR